MSAEPSDELRVFRECEDKQLALPQPTPAELVERQSQGLAALLEGAGIEACRTGTVAGIGFLPPFAAGGSISSGCEQLAAISSIFDARQKIFNCAFSNFSTKQATTVVSNLQIDANLESFSAKGCSIVVTQSGKIDVTKYTELKTDVQTAMNSSLNATMERFVENLQSEEKKGLFGTSEGQKVIQNFAQSVQNDISNKAYTNVITQVMETYNQSGRINLRLGPGSSMSFANIGSGNFVPPCITLNQNFTLNLVSTNILANTLAIAFSSDAGVAMKETIRNIQERSSDTGFSLPSGGIIAVIIIVVIVLIILLSLKGKSDSGGGSNQPPKPVLSGPAGKITGIVLMTIGFAVIVTAIVLFILKVNVIVSSLVLLGGLILAGFGIGIFLKARSQQTEFEQKIQLSRVKQGLSPLTAEQLQQAVNPKAVKAPKILPSIQQQQFIPVQQQQPVNYPLPLPVTQGNITQPQQQRQVFYSPASPPQQQQQQQPISYAPPFIQQQPQPINYSQSGVAQQATTNYPFYPQETYMPQQSSFVPQQQTFVQPQSTFQSNRP